MSESKQNVSNNIDLAKLIRKRGSIKARLTIFQKYISKYPSEILLPNAECDELELRVAKMESLSLEFDDVQLEIECLCEDPDEQYIEREVFENSYLNAMVQARALLGRTKRARSGSPDDNGSQGSQFQSMVKCNQGDDACPDAHHSGSSKVRPYQIKLPTISLPKFDGTFQNWLQFRDTFRSLVHDNYSLDDISKFHYLRASLEGAASNLISSLELTTSNYPIAWDTIVERYDNNRLLINKYVKALFDAKLSRETSKDLRELVDSYNKNLRSLKALGEATEGWDTLLVHIVTTKLDISTLKEWETFRSSLKKVDYAALSTFLKNRADLLESVEGHNKVKAPIPSNLSKPQVNRGMVSLNDAQSKWKCVVCKGDHTIYHCVDFLKETIPKRQEIVNKVKACYNCLRVGHTTSNCRHSSCRICGKRHNSLLHVKNDDTQQEQQTSADSKIITTTARMSHQVLLSTACVKLFDKEGNAHTVRALLDCGSTSCFITEKLAKILQPEMLAVNTSVTGLNNRLSSIANKCALHLQSIHGSFEATIDCYVICNITEPLPAYTIHLQGIQIPHNVHLADPEFTKPGDIDLLLGADIFWNLVQTKRIHLGKNQPTLQETKLGWVVSGSVPATPKVRCHFASTMEVQDQLARFWELEEVAEVKPWSNEEHICETIFKETTERLSDGRFLVQVPLKQDASVLGDSFTMAERRFLSLERKLHANLKLYDSYKEFINEYESLGHMSKVTSDSNTRSTENKAKDYYLPHHGVIREDSLTTKLRVVFDASAKTSNGLSFNDIQLVGPVVQDDILSILLRFRQHAIVVSADIAKMYRQILVREDQRPLQKIIWRENKNDPYTMFQLNTVTYGTASAPYLAIRCLKQLADECKDRSIGTVIEHDFYVDDLLSGADTIEEATRISQEVNKQLLSGCLELRKWRSNNKDVLASLSDVAADCQYTFNESPVSKVLGLLWNSETDTLGYKLSSPKVNKDVTKRSILTTVSQIFDPLGLVSPTVIQTKVLLQRLWLQKLDWDDTVPNDIASDWNEIVETLSHHNALTIPRHVLLNNPKRIEIHIFSDASEKAYGACAYVRSIDSNDTVHSHLLCAKGKVAPLKSTTLPRLELCGALVASRLCQKIQQSLRLTIDKFIFWSDSSIVLGWLGTQPSNLKTFVRNRVSKIQDATASFTWRYVASEANPADVLSRGIKADTIGKHELWWHGPSFLKSEEHLWPTHECINSVDLPEQRIISNVVANPNLQDDLVDTILNRYSTLLKMKRVLAYILRFINNAKTTKAQRVNGPLSCDELNKALNILIKGVQAKHFSKEIEIIKSNKELPRKSSFTKLLPFICPMGFVRVQGRLSQSSASYDTKHPIILPERDILTTRVFEDQHIKSMHAGPQLLLANVRQRYWPIGGRNLARATVHKCVTCRRLAARVTYPVMGNLPAARVEVEVESPFYVSGLDFAGPIMISTKKGRGAKHVKAYICVIVCFASKGIHLELASDMTSATFILALKRFIARRGKPAHIYCDNGSNFVGAWNKLKAKLPNELSDDGIQFHFTPPYAPNFGGLWEAGVKSVKYHLKRVLGLAHLTYEELTTTLYQIEAILNSRPITPLSSSPHDLQPLTPGHFLISRPLTSLPEPTCSVGTSTQRYQRIEQLRQHFWQRWNKEYVSQLQERNKWKVKGPTSVKVGSLVIIKEENLPPLKWKMGRITALHPGQDGIVRVVDIATQAGICRRPITKICPLEVD